MNRLEIRNTLLKNIEKIKEDYIDVYIKDRDIDVIKEHIKRSEKILAILDATKKAVQSGLVEVTVGILNYSFAIEIDHDRGIIELSSNLVGERHKQDVSFIEAIEQKVREIKEANEKNLKFWTEELDLYYKDEDGEFKKLPR